MSKEKISIVIIFIILPFLCFSQEKERVHEDALLHHSIETKNHNHTESLLADSVKVTIWGEILPNSVIFSVYKDKEGVMEQELSPHRKERLTIAETKLILKRISKLFVESEDNVIISKKYSPEVVIAGYPHVEFEIHIGGKVRVKKYTVATRQEHYEITYSKPFVDLYNYIFGNAKGLCERSEYMP